MNINGVDVRSDFGDPVGEAAACRNDCALFDFSFIASARITGKGAREAVEKFASRSVAQLADRRIVYALRVNKTGHAISDLTIWKNASDSFDVMSGSSDDIKALCDMMSESLHVQDIAEESVVLAVQGPSSLEVMCELGVRDETRKLKYFSFCDCVISGIPCRIGRLGYTGEAGFEIIVGRENAAKVWKLISPQARPAGFIAADALRIEAGFVLFTNEFRLPVFPSDAGLEKFHSGSGKSSPAIKLVTFAADSDDFRPLPWHPASPLSHPASEQEIVITSACHSVCDRRVIGLGYIRKETSPDAKLVDPSGIFRNISQVHTPFYDRQKTRPREAW